MPNIMGLMFLSATEDITQWGVRPNLSASRLMGAEGLLKPPLHPAVDHAVSNTRRSVSREAMTNLHRAEPMMYSDQEKRNLVGRLFEDTDVAKCYPLRPPYSSAMFRFLLKQVDGRERALDLGCGTGKIASRLADEFREVTALDASAAMLDVGRRLDAGIHKNIHWALARAEAFQSSMGFDLVTAGTSIQWPDHSKLFPKLAKWTPILAVITGDEPVPPCGEAAWAAFLRRWLTRVAKNAPDIVRDYNPAALRAEMSRYEAWMDIAGRRRFRSAYRQLLANFVESHHSRATWSRSTMGAALAAEFDEDLKGLMLPFASNNVLRLTLVTELTWGRPRESPVRNPKT